MPVTQRPWQDTGTMRSALAVLLPLDGTCETHMLPLVGPTASIGPQEMGHKGGRPRKHPHEEQ